jgi:SAM-dependent methyltransferase
MLVAVISHLIASIEPRVMTCRIHLALMQPAGYIHSQGFLDQARYARHQLRRLGAEVTIGKNRLREDSVNIIFGAHLGFAASLKERYTCVFFNLEQLGKGGARVAEAYLDLLRTSPTIDYDERNLRAYGRKPGEVPVVSFAWAPYLTQMPSLPLAQRPIDLLFFGSINERRLALFSRIEACGWSVSRFDQPLYGEERDEFIRKSKAVLNCHFYESSRFEQARAFHTLSLGTPVISERTARTTPPAAFEDAVTWITDDQLESFFRQEFMTSAWQAQAEKQLQNFAGTDVGALWETVHTHCTAVWKREQATRATQIWRPSVMNLGSGKDYKLGWLNVDILERAQPDLLLDLGQAVTLPLQASTQSGGQVRLEANSLDGIYANNVLEHVPDLPRLMTNLLALLKQDGQLEVEVPYEQAPSAWQDPTHLRAMNKNSWLYYTGWFWYLGWFEHRFELTDFRWLSANLEPCQEGEAAFMKVSLKKVSTTPHERAIARTMQSDFGGIPSDLPEGGCQVPASTGADAMPAEPVISITDLAQTPP